MSNLTNLIAALVIILRRNPWPDIPFGTALVAASLGVLAASAVVHLPIEQLVDGTGTTALSRTIAATAVAANLLNNLPARSSWRSPPSTRE